MTTSLAATKLGEQQVILHDVSWATYERLLIEHQAGNTTRCNYDQGLLEIITLSQEHEKLKQTLSTLVEILAAELELDNAGAGATTFRRGDLARGFEPDACFYFAQAELIRQKRAIDLTTEPPPELVVEIDITSPALDKFPIFAALGVAEVWRYDGAQVGLFRRGAGTYEAIGESVVLPGLGGALIKQLLGASQTMKRHEWLRSIRQAAQQVKRDRP